MDPKIAAKTQNTLGRLIKKPPLTEKLLGRPPFRFLHDIMTSVISTTGFMRGLFTEAELRSDSFKDKYAKMDFLQKAIDMVSVATGHTLSVSPAKIVAGYEPEKTNDFLQRLAEGISRNIDNEGLVRKVLKKHSKKSSGKDDKNLVGEQEDGRRNNKENDRDYGKDGCDKRSEKKKRTDSPSKAGGHEGDQGRRRSNRLLRKTPACTERVPTSLSILPPVCVETASPGMAGEPALEPQSPADQGDAGKTLELAETKDPGKTTTQAISPLPSLVEDEDIEQCPKTPFDITFMGENDSCPQYWNYRAQRTIHTRQGPPRPKHERDRCTDLVIKGPNGLPAPVITDKEAESDEEEMILMGDSAPSKLPSISNEVTDIDKDGEHGALVRKMLDLKNTVARETVVQKTEIERPVNMDTVRKRREAVQREVNTLRAFLQCITCNANPLSRLIEHLQEDMDSMNTELRKWHQENKEHSRSIKREKEVTYKTLKPLQDQLEELDAAILTQLNLTGAIKSKILRNDARMTLLLHTISKTK